MTASGGAGLSEPVPHGGTTPHALVSADGTCGRLRGVHPCFIAFILDCEHREAPSTGTTHLPTSRGPPGDHTPCRTLNKPHVGEHSARTENTL